MNKNKLLAPDRANKTIKNAVNSMIKNISVIAIFAAIGVVLLLYLGPEINLATALVVRLAVPSVVLTISIIIIYELWLINGQRCAAEEPEYIELLELYAKKSENLHYPTAQDFLDAERLRRYHVEYDRLTRLLEREKSILEKAEAIEKKTLKDRYYIRFKCKRFINKITRRRDRINVFMPYEKSEEFDYLRYNLQDSIYKEYSPKDTRAHLTKSRAKKYRWTIMFTLVGLNILSIGGSMGNLWVAIIMTTLAVISLILSVVQGFSTGYRNIKIISTGVYKTANSFLDQAVAYCLREGKELYYKGPTEFRKADDIKSLDGAEFNESKEELDFFAKAEIEVTKNYTSGI